MLYYLKLRRKTIARFPRKDFAKNFDFNSSKNIHGAKEAFTV